MRNCRSVAMSPVSIRAGAANERLSMFGAPLVDPAWSHGHSVTTSIITNQIGTGLPHTRPVVTIYLTKLEKPQHINKLVSIS